MAWAALALGALTGILAAQEPAPGTPSLDAYRDTLRRFFALREYARVLEVAAEAERAYPGQEMVALYRSQAQRRLSEAAQPRPLPYPSLRDRPVVFETPPVRPSPTPHPITQIEPATPPPDAGAAPAAATTPAPAPRIGLAVGPRELIAAAALGLIILTLAAFVLLRRRREAPAEAAAGPSAAMEPIVRRAGGPATPAARPVAAAAPAAERVKVWELEAEEHPFEPFQIAEPPTPRPAPPPPIEPVPSGAGQRLEFVEPEMAELPQLRQPEPPPTLPAEPSAASAGRPQPPPAPTEPPEAEPADVFVSPEAAETQDRERVHAAEEIRVGPLEPETAPEEATQTAWGGEVEETARMSEEALAEDSELVILRRPGESAEGVQVFRANETVRVQLGEEETEAAEVARPGGASGEVDTRTGPGEPDVQSELEVFERERRLGLAAFGEARWDEAVRHLSLAAALRPEALEIKDHLRRARRMRKAPPA